MRVEVGKKYEVLDDYLGFRKGHIVEIVDVDVDDEDLLCTIVNGNSNVRVYIRDFEKMDIKEITPQAFKPAHYDTSIDTIDFMKANFSREAVEGFMRGNAIKYLQRAGKKGDKLDDLRKSAHYLQMLIEWEEEQ